MSAINPNAPLPATASLAADPAQPRRRSPAWTLIHSTNWFMARLSGTRIIPLWAVLEHRGRRSGRSYATPIAARRTPDGFVIPMPFGGETDWARNVLAAGGCTIRWKGRRYELAAPEIVDREGARTAFHSWQRAVMRRTGIDQFLRLRDVH